MNRPCSASRAVARLGYIPQSHAAYQGFEIEIAKHATVRYQCTAMTEEPTASNRPVFSRRLGNVEVSVWQHKGAGDGKDFYNATFRVHYQKDGEWKTGDSYGPIDLACQSTLNQMASAYIAEQMHQRGRSK